MPPFARLILAFLAAAVAGAAAPAAANMGAAPAAADPGAAAPTELERAKTWAEEGRFGPALDALRPLVLREPGNADAWSVLGFALRKSGDPALALAAYERALALDPHHKGANEYLGELWLERAEPARARERLGALLAACPAGCEERAELEAAIATFERSGAKP